MQAEILPQKMPEGARSILIIGYGNISRRDDGVALHIVQRLSQQLGGAKASINGESEQQLLPGLKTVFVHQLAPELGELIAEHDTVVFVDAHVDGVGWDEVHWQEVPAAYTPGMVGHHLKPSSVMAVARELFGHTGDGFVLSVLGTDFDFGEEMTSETSARADIAVERLLALVQEHGLMEH